MGIGTQGYMPKAGSSARARARRKARRIIKPGYPCLKPFRSRSEIEAYFASDYIECLLCGRQMKGLGNHLQRIHGTSEDTYRKQYGLPWRRGLTGALTHTRYVDVGNRQDKERLRALSLEFQPLAAHTAHKSKTPIQLQESKERILKAAGLVELDEAAFDRFLTAIATGMTPREVAALPDMPGLSTWRRKRREDADYEARFKTIWDDLPFPVQARAEMLGARFEKACEQLFYEGKSDQKIADILGVTTMSVNKRTRKLRAQRVVEPKVRA